MVCVSLRSSTTLYVVKWWGVHRYSVNNLHPVDSSDPLHSVHRSISSPSPSVHSTPPLTKWIPRIPGPAARQPPKAASVCAASPDRHDTYLPSRAIEQGDASMVYYRPAPIGADLRYGFERRVERDESVEEHLDGLCDALRVLHEGGRGAERLGGVVTWRGMMTRIMTAPFEDRDGWEMNCVPLGGSIYLELDDPPEKRSYRAKDSAKWALQSYMGYSYESFSTTTPEGDPEDSPEGWSGDVNTNVQWCNIVRSAIGEIPLCLGGEVDCVQAEVGAPNPGLDACVELKTNKVIDSDRADMVFHKKLLKHWAQSFLLGVPTVELGFRTEEGIIAERHLFETERIPALVASGPRPAWYPTPCLHFLHAVLGLLVRHLLPADPRPPGAPPVYASEGNLPPAPTFRLRFTPRRGVELFRLPSVNSERWGGILTEDYTRHVLERDA
ncbi:Protein rai1 [Apiotrichum porosum]|uniref:Decapping nuclease n=1 Tax=Apiotrichum porosum TaxID=105984 RepID=A0A427XCQ4_9TREE|nr:Protein rai1 [Apiotrichum porosum]RSH76626.1 Protein rai1 [Apiotrichum porosum]